MKELTPEDEKRVQIAITPEFISEMIRIRSFKRAYREAESIHERWAIIRRAYEYLTPIIMERAQGGYLGATMPYIVDWWETFSPIEYDAWCSIRYRGVGL